MTRTISKNKLQTLAELPPFFGKSTVVPPKNRPATRPTRRLTKLQTIERPAIIVRNAHYRRVRAPLVTKV